MDRGAWQATVHGIARVRHDLATKLLQNCNLLSNSSENFIHTQSHVYTWKETQTGMYIYIHLVEELMEKFCNVFANFLQMSNCLKIHVLTVRKKLILQDILISCRYTDKYCYSQVTERRRSGSKLSSKKKKKKKNLLGERRAMLDIYLRMKNKDQKKR